MRKRERERKREGEGGPGDGGGDLEQGSTSSRKSICQVFHDVHYKHPSAESPTHTYCTFSFQ